MSHVPVRPTTATSHPTTEADTSTSRPQRQGHYAALPAFRQVRTPDSARTLGRVLKALLATTLITLIVTPWQQTSVGSGRVVAYAPLERQQVIEAPTEGRIRQWHVAEGSRVRKGDPIVSISDNDPAILDRLRQERLAISQRVAAAQARVGAISARIGQLSTARTNAIAGAGDRVRMADQRVKAARKAVEAAQAAERVAGLNLTRQQALNSQGLASDRQLEMAQMDEARTRVEVERAQASLQAAISEVSSLAADQLRLGADTGAAVESGQADRAAAQAEIANAQAELARIDVRLSRQQAQEVFAPRDGTILRLHVNQDTEMVKTGDSLAVLVPDTEARAVELWVTGNDVPLLREGRHARLQFEGWPAVQFSGWPMVAVGTFGGKVALVDATDNGKGMFRVLIVPDGGKWPDPGYLRQGVRAQGWILLDRVKLIYELWRQFNGFPMTVTQAETAKEAQPLGPVKRK
jgi:multidrug efflux pump subunit AcrA (membrane-fusion protein)